MIDRKESVLKYVTHFAERFESSLKPISLEKLAYRVLSIDGGGYTPRTAFFEDIVAEIEWLTLPNVNEISEHWWTHFPSCTVQMSGLYAVVIGLREKSITLGIITKGKGMTQNTKIEHLRIRSLFDVVIVSEEVNVRKPEKRIFQIALDRLNISASEAWFVGDNVERDIVGAMSVGMSTIWIRHGREWPSSLERPTIVVDSLCEIGHWFDV